MNHAEAIRLLDAWYALPDEKPPGYWDAFEAEIEGHRSMMVLTNVHTLIELNEHETALLRDILETVVAQSQEHLSDAARLLVAELRFQLPHVP